MQELLTNFSADMASGPAWVGIWVNIMGPILLLSIPFAIVRREVLWAAIGIIAGMASTLILYSYFGYERILGLGHVTFWTPVMVYLWMRRDTWLVRSTWVGKWILLAFIVMGISLAFDYVDVARWLLGERG